MRSAGPDPVLLRQSANALLRLADSIETGATPAIPLSSEPFAHISDYLLAQLANEEIELGLKRRKTIDIGSLSDEAFFLLLAIIAAADVKPTMADLARKAGLPVTSCMRLLTQLGNDGYVILEPTPSGDGTLRIQVSGETQGRVAAHLLQALGSLAPAQGRD